MRVSKPGGLVFNFSELPAAPTYLYKKAATTRREQAEAESSPVIEVEDDGSPLFVPLGDRTPDQTEMISTPTNSQGARRSAGHRMNPPARNKGSTQTPARPPLDGHNSKAKANATQQDQRSDPKSERRAYRDIKGIAREIWQPGDPHGQRSSEYSDNRFTKRWRFFQSNIGPIVRGTNSPPHYVALDDKAAWDIISSKEYTNKERGDFWALDFTSGSGRLFANRVNKGRAAVVAKGTGTDFDEGDGQGVRHVASVEIGEKKNRRLYYFSGEKGGIYQEAVFSVPTAADQTAERCDKNKPGKSTANRKDGSKTGVLGKRKAEESLNPRHEREKVGKYLYSTPSPTWPGGSRRLNKPPVQRAKDANGGLKDRFYGSELSPEIAAGGKTVYAANVEEEPERVKGRLVTSGWRTPHGTRTEYSDGTNTPWVDRSMDGRTGRPGPASGVQTQRLEVRPNSQPPHHDTGRAQDGEALWQAVKRMEQELEQTRGLLRSRDGEIVSLRAQINNPKADGTLRAKDVEIQQLKEESRQALSGDY